MPLRSAFETDFSCVGQDFSLDNSRGAMLPSVIDLR